jgi:hypothetical protein
VKGREPIQRWGKTPRRVVVPAGLPNAEREILERAQRDGFITHRRSTGYRARNVWFALCERHREPYITITERNLYATVAFDLIACEAVRSRLTPHDTVELRVLLNSFTAPAKGEHLPGSLTADELARHFNPPTYMQAARVPIPHAPALAKALRQYLMEARDLPARPS